ncbi:MAG: hypothetical protein WC894_04845 [Patescibacteria group bacterium]
MVGKPKASKLPKMLIPHETVIEGGPIIGTAQNMPDWVTALPDKLKRIEGGGQIYKRAPKKPRDSSQNGESKG